MDIEKRAHHLSERLNYIRDIFDGKHPEDIELLHNRLNEFFRRATEGIQSDPDAELTTLEELFTFMERKLETKIQPMDKVRIVRHLKPQRRLRFRPTGGHGRRYRHCSGSKYQL